MATFVTNLKKSSLEKQQKFLYKKEEKKKKIVLEKEDSRKKIMIQILMSLFRTHTRDNTSCGGNEKMMGLVDNQLL